MAFNWNTFWTRALTALIFVAVMALGMLYNQWSFFILFSIIHFGCWIEYLKLIEKIYSASFHPYLKIGFILLGFHLLLLFCTELYISGYAVDKNFSLPVLISGFVFVLLGIFQTKQLRIKGMLALVLGILYISFSIGLLYNLRFTDTIHLLKDQSNLPDYSAAYFIPVLIVVSLWVNDTMAYLVGSAIGRTPFSKISPKKTLEGTIGGMLLCVLAVTFFLKIWFRWDALLVISFTVAVFGTMGDLFESLLKRKAGVKDSGRILPGHGGFLDRFDSFLWAVPFVWLVLELLFS